MPFWKIYAPENTFTAEQKKSIAKDVTEGYSALAGMPKFFVVVVFQEVSAESFYVGGESVDNFVRIVVDHIARVTPVEARPLVMHLIEQQLAPHIKERGLEWELHIDETPIDLWRVQGLPAPPFGSEAEKQWVSDNKATPYDGMVIPDTSPEAMLTLAALNPALAETAGN
jgi:4-oxalocrotonate tautomerase family enzyme